jgi:acetamidase/formamidase
MQRFTRQNLFRNNVEFQQCPTAPRLRVAQGESFLIETVDTGHRNITSPGDRGKPDGPMAGNPWTGPVHVEGIQAGDVIAVSIESIAVEDHCLLPITEESLLPADIIEVGEDFIAIADGLALFSGGIRVPIRPMFGCFGVVPLSTPIDPSNHGGNMDIPEIRAGSVVHLRCEREGGYFGCGDGHALQGEGEINGFSLEVSLVGQLRIDRSPYQNLRSILI